MSDERNGNGSLVIRIHPAIIGALVFAITGGIGFYVANRVMAYRVDAAETNIKEMKVVASDHGNRITTLEANYTNIMAGIADLKRRPR